MKHATSTALRSIDALLRKLREFDGLTERKPGVFYRKSAAFIHFHEDPGKMFADIKTGSGWRRMAVNSKKEIARFLREAKSALAKPVNMRNGMFFNGVELGGRSRRRRRG